MESFLKVVGLFVAILIPCVMIVTVFYVLDIIDKMKIRNK